MSFLSQKNRHRSLLYIRLGIIFCVLLSILLSFSVYERYQVKSEMSERRVEAEEDLSDLKERKEVIERKVDYLSREEGIEAEIRKYFDVAREGEQVVVLVGEGQTNDTALLPEMEDKKRPFWLQWLPW